MSFSSTTNYSLQKPAVGTEIDDWGDDINTNFDLIDTRMKLNADAAAAASTAAGTKAPLVHSHAQADVTGLVADLALKAPLASPFLTGTPQAPTALSGTNTAQLATTAFVTTAVAAVSGGVAAHTHPISDVTGLQTALDAAVKTEVGQAKSGNYTLVAGDAGTMITFNAAATVTVNSSVFPANSRVDFINLGSGDVSFSGSATIRSSGGKLKLNGQYAGGTLWFISGSECVLVGDLKT